MLGICNLQVSLFQRTAEILQSREDSLKQSLSRMEAEKGVSGFRDTQTAMANLSDTTADIDQAKGKTLEQMSDMVSTLNGKISERKTNLAPIIKELRPLRQQVKFRPGRLLGGHLINAELFLSQS